MASDTTNPSYEPVSEGRTSISSDQTIYDADEGLESQGLLHASKYNQDPSAAGPSRIGDASYQPRAVEQNPAQPPTETFNISDADMESGQGQTKKPWSIHQKPLYVIVPAILLVMCLLLSLAGLVIFGLVKLGAAVMGVDSVVANFIVGLLIVLFGTPVILGFVCGALMCSLSCVIPEHPSVKKYLKPKKEDAQGANSTDAAQPSHGGTAPQTV